MVAVGLATFVVGHRTIYRSQLASRADSPANRFRFALPLLAAVQVGDAARRPRLTLSVTERVGDALGRLQAAGVPGAPVVNADDDVVGVVDADDLTGLDPGTVLEHHIKPRDPVLRADDGLDEALGALADHHRNWAPVVAGSRLTGTLSVRDIMDAYRTALSGNVRQVRALRTDGVVIEAEISVGSALDDRSVAEVGWPRDAVLVSVERNEALIVPRGDLTLKAGDRLSVFASPAAGKAVRALLTSVPGPDDVPPKPSPPLATT
jgi:CIC family chloride channel protein